MKFGQYDIYVGSAPIILPDIGTFFNQDIEMALSLTQQIAASGCSFLKAEILHTADICLPGETLEPYYDGKSDFVQENYRGLIERKVLSLESYSKIFRYARSLELGIVVSIYDFEGVDFAVKEGVCALKIASSNIVHAPLIKYAAKTLLPLIIDTGRANMDEIARAVHWAKEAGCKNLIVEHSPSAPPVPLSSHLLPMMKRFELAFDVLPGLSDHHAGEEMMYAAAALGVPILEKGVCLDNAPIDQDVYHALPISKLKEVVQKCHNIHQAMGSDLRYIPKEKKKTSDRMCLVAKKDLQEGDMISLDNVMFAFPQIGIPVEMWEIVENKFLHHSVPKGSPIYWHNVSFPA